jgi:serine/threonine-protein kinase
MALRMPKKLKLAREWILADRIGGGGFGQVYAAKSAEGDSAVVKLVPKAPGAGRELLFVDVGGARNVVPIIDVGETDSHWALVMPRADIPCASILIKRPLHSAARTRSPSLGT